MPSPEAADITIAHLGIGNVGSVVNMLRHIGHPGQVASTSEELAAAEKVILLGVGHWETAIRRMDALGMREALQSVADRGVPLLGICLGMQMLLDGSEEGPGSGLGFVPGRAVKFRRSTVVSGRPLKVPHMGWNMVKARKDGDPIVTQLEPDSRFYFVHSYHAEGVPLENILLTSEYGYEFACGVQRGNVWGFQFHPEKSHRFGMALMRAFAEV